MGVESALPSENREAALTLAGRTFPALGNQVF